MDKKFILTDETQTHYSHIMHRIKALKDFGNITRPPQSWCYVEEI